MQSSRPACDGHAFSNEISESILPKCQPAHPSASSCEPFALESPPALPVAKTLSKPSNVSYKLSSSIKPQSLETSAVDRDLQLRQVDTGNSAAASPESRRRSLTEAKLLQRPFARECFNSVDALSTCDKAETLAPITVQNVSRIYLRRSHLEELLSDQRFTLLIVYAFVRIRLSEHKNNYRLVQITGTSTLHAYYQVGERKTNVVLKVLNLNKQQEIRIDHVSNRMFTEEECQRLQLSAELGFINAPTMKFLERKATALKRGKAMNKCLDEQLSKLATSKGASKHPGLSKEVRVIWNKDGKNSSSADHSVERLTQANREKQVQAEQVLTCVEPTFSIAGERGSEPFEAVPENSGVEKQAALVLCQPEKRQNQCPIRAMDKNRKRKIHVHLNAVPTSSEKQVDADQHSDISVEMSTVFTETGENKICPSEVFSAIPHQCCTQDEAELNPPKKVQKNDMLDEAESTSPMKAQKKGLQSSGSKKYLIKEHWQSLGAETMMMHTQIDAPPKANLNEAQINGESYMDAIHQCDVGVNWAPKFYGIVEDRMHEGKFSSNSVVNLGTKVATSGFPKGIPSTESQKYGVMNSPADNDTGTTFQVENQACTEEYMTVLANDDFHTVDKMQWFYQDMKQSTFGPFSLKQLRKWSRTAVFPPNLKIWRTIAGQKSSILLVDALNAQEIDEFIFEADDSFAVENCLNPLQQEGNNLTESGSACQALSKEISDDKELAIARTDGLSPLVHAEQRQEQSVSIESMNLKPGALWTAPHSTQVEDMPIEVSQDKHAVTNKEFESALSSPTEMLTNGCWKLHSSALETCNGREVKSRSDTEAIVSKLNATDTQAKDTFADGERGVQSKTAHMSEKEMSALKVTKGRFSPACMEGKSSSTCMEQDTAAPSDNVCSLSQAGKPEVGNLSRIFQSSQFEVLKEEVASVQTSQCESPCNFDVQVSINRPEMAIQRGTVPSVDADMNFQSLEEETPDRKRESSSVTQKQKIIKLNEGWKSEFELETWETQYNALMKKEASIDRDHDEILSKLIDVVNVEECNKSTPAKSNGHALLKDTTVYDLTSCDSEHTKKLATLDGVSVPLAILGQQTGWDLPKRNTNDRWGSPGKLEEVNVWGSSNTILYDGWGTPGELDKRTAGWGSPNVSRFNQSEQQISMVKSSREERSSKKRQLKQVETENTQASLLYDGIYKDNDAILCRREKSLPYEMRLEKNQRGAESSQGNGREQRVDNTNCKGSGIGQDMSLSKGRADQRNFCYRKCTGDLPTKVKIYGKGTKSRHKKSHSRGSIIRSKEGKSWSGERYFSDKRKTALEPTRREVETASMRSHSQEAHEQRRLKKDEKFFSRQLKVSVKFGYEKASGKEKENLICHARNGWKVISKEQRSSPENNENQTKREVRKYYAKNDKRSLSGEPRSSPDGARQSVEKHFKLSHDWRSISRNWKASPENTRYRKGGRFDSATAQRDISMEKMVYHDAAGERRTHSRNDCKQAKREHKTSPESHGRRASTHEPSTQTSDRGWTPLDSPFDYTARCWSIGTVGLGKSDDPFVFSDFPNKPKAHLSCKIHSESPQHTWSGSHPELLPPPEVPVSTTPSQIKWPPPPLLPADTSHICHINSYNV